MKGLNVTKVLQKLFSTNKLAGCNYLEVIMNKGISNSPLHTSCSLCISAATHKNLSTLLYAPGHVYLTSLCCYYYLFY